jgi:hypothetical protein
VAREQARHPSHPAHVLVTVLPRKAEIPREMRAQLVAVQVLDAAALGRQLGGKHGGERGLSTRRQPGHPYDAA